MERLQIERLGLNGGGCGKSGFEIRETLRKVPFVDSALSYYLGGG